MKHQKNRVDRSAEDKREALREQILLLVLHCAQYDAGHRALAKPMAAALRLLVHHRGNSHSLLEQLSLRSGRFFTVAPPLNPRNLATECNLVAMQLSDAGAQYIPMTPDLGLRDRKPFAEWWSGPVLKGRGGVTMSRRDVVLAVADMDGGAHVDPGLDHLYHSFRTGELLAWQVSGGGFGQWIGAGTQSAPLSAENAEYILAPQYACIRSITHEFLLTMRKYAAWAFTQPYVYTPLGVPPSAPA